MCRMWWPLTLTYIFKVIRPWLWKSCPLCNVFSSRSIIFWLGIQYDPIVWVIMRRRGVSSERRRSSCSSCEHFQNMCWSVCNILIQYFYEHISKNMLVVSDPNSGTSLTNIGYFMLFVSDPNSGTSLTNIVYSRLGHTKRITTLYLCGGIIIHPCLYFSSSLAKPLELRTWMSNYIPTCSVHVISLHEKLSWPLVWLEML